MMLGTTQTQTTMAATTMMMLVKYITVRLCDAGASIAIASQTRYGPTADGCDVTNCMYVCVYRICTCICICVFSQHDFPIWPLVTCSFAKLAIMLMLSCIVILLYSILLLLLLAVHTLLTLLDIWVAQTSQLTFAYI